MLPYISMNHFLRFIVLTESYNKETSAGDLCHSEPEILSQISAGIPAGSALSRAHHVPSQSHR